MAPRFTYTEKFIRQAMFEYWRHPCGQRIRFAGEVLDNDDGDKLVILNNTYGCQVINKDAPENPCQLGAKISMRPYLGFTMCDGMLLVLHEADIMHLNNSWWEGSHG